MDIVEGPDLRRLRWKEGLAVVGKFSGGHEKSKDIFKDWAVRSIDSIVNKNKQIQIKAQAIKWKKNYGHNSVRQLLLSLTQGCW